MSTTDRQFFRLVAFFHADERPIFSGFKFASIARSQAWLGLSFGHFQSEEGFWIITLEHCYFICFSACGKCQHIYVLHCANQVLMCYSCSSLAELQERLRVLDGAEVGFEQRNTGSNPSAAAEAAAGWTSVSTCCTCCSSADSDWDTVSTANCGGSRHLFAYESGL